jgi:hypothetical protein
MYQLTCHVCVDVLRVMRHVMLDVICVLWRIMSDVTIFDVTYVLLVDICCTNKEFDQHTPSTYFQLLQQINNYATL